MIKAVTFDQHRWYTVVRIEHEDGTIEEPVIGNSFPGEGPSKFKSVEAFAGDGTGHAATIVRAALAGHIAPDRVRHLLPLWSERVQRLSAEQRVGDASLVGQCLRELRCALDEPPLTEEDAPGEVMTSDQERDNIAMNAICAALLDRFGFLPLSERYAIARRALSDAQAVAQAAWRNGGRSDAR